MKPLTFFDTSMSSGRAVAGRRIYMDANGSMPLPPTVVTAMTDCLGELAGNPSSSHWAGHYAVEQLDHARGKLAGLIDARQEEIVFTSGATEANNMAIKGIANIGAGRATMGHYITSAIEHDAVLRPMRYLRSIGARVTVLPVDGYGRVDPDTVAAAIRPDTRLISIMHTNNEVGTIQPIAEIAAVANSASIPFHTDAAQAIGKQPVDVGVLGVDLLSLTGHKFGAPPGIGALFVRRGIRLQSLLMGGGQERGQRAGTESALLATGLGAAVDALSERTPKYLTLLRDYFWQRLQDTFGDRVINNSDVRHTVPNTLSVSFPGYVGGELLARMPHVAASTGSACHAGCVDMSHVLIAMGLSTERGVGTIRFSLCRRNTLDDVDDVIDALEAAMS